MKSNLGLRRLDGDMALLEEEVRRQKRDDAAWRGGVSGKHAHMILALEPPVMSGV